MLLSNLKPASPPPYTHTCNFRYFILFNTEYTGFIDANARSYRETLGNGASVQDVNGNTLLYTVSEITSAHLQNVQSKLPPCIERCVPLFTPSLHSTLPIFLAHMVA